MTTEDALPKCDWPGCDNFATYFWRSLKDVTSDHRFDRDEHGGRVPPDTVRRYEPGERHMRCRDHASK